MNTQTIHQLHGSTIDYTIGNIIHRKQNVLYIKLQKITNCLWFYTKRHTNTIMYNNTTLFYQSQCNTNNIIIAAHIYGDL